MTRSNNRPNDALRPVRFETHFTKHAEGSVLSVSGDTKVLCNTSIQEGVPRFLRDKQQGWLTAEYSMLPRATHTRSERDSTRFKSNGRSVEIQRLIGRSLRNCIDLYKLPDLTIIVDCDVLQADGGTRVCAINGAVVSVVQALQSLQYKNILKKDPLRYLLTAFSVGIKNNTVLLDLDYQEDSSIDADCNLVFTEHGDIIEIQATGEQAPIKAEHLSQAVACAQKAQDQLLQAMRQAIG